MGSQPNFSCCSKTQPKRIVYITKIVSRVSKLGVLYTLGGHLGYRLFSIEIVISGTFITGRQQTTDAPWPVETARLPATKASTVSPQQTNSSPLTQRGFQDEYYEYLLGLLTASWACSASPEYECQFKKYQKCWDDWIVSSSFTMHATKLSSCNTQWLFWNTLFLRTSHHAPSSAILDKAGYVLNSGWLP